MDFSNKSLKAQMKRANRFAAPYVMILGDDELKQGSAILRNMATKEQESVAFDDIVEADDGRFGKGPGYCAHNSATIHDHIGFSNQDQAHRPACGADVYRCVIAV